MKQRTRISIPSLNLHLPPPLRELLHDHWVWPPVVLAVVVNAGLLAFIWIQANNLRAQFGVVAPLVPLHFDASGQPDRVDSVNALFTLPLIGLIVLVVNILFGALIYRRERLATYLLILAANLVQLFLWIAAITIMRTVT